MKKNPYIPAVLYLLVAMMPMAIGFDAVSVVLAGALLAFFYAMLGSSVWGIGGAVVFLVALAVYKLNIVNTAVFTVLTLPVSFFIGRGFSKKKSFASTMLSGAIAGIISVAGSLLFVMQRFNMSAFNVLFGSAIDAMEQALATSGMQDTFTGFALQLETALPAILVITTCFAVYTVFGIARAWLAKNGIVYENMPVFSELRLSSGFTTVFLAIIAVSLFSGIGTITLNIITVVTMMFTVCGVSVCDYFLKSKNVKTVFRVIIYIAAFFLMGIIGFAATAVSGILFLLGVVDSYRPLRKRDNEVI